MLWYNALYLLLGSVILFITLGFPIAFAFFLANIIGAFIFLGGGIGIEAFVRGSMSSITNFSLAPIPFFLLIGEILLKTGLAFRAVDAIDGAIRQIPGRLAVVAVTGGTVFSALSGSTVATTAMLGKSLVPDMLKRGYHPSMATGPIMAIGGVDMLIPPSNLAVIFATLASSVSVVKVSVSQLLIAGTLPGLIMSVAFIGYIVARCWWNPRLAPSSTPAAEQHASRWTPLLVDVFPLLSIFVVIIGSMYMGWASPTDSAALGCIATVLLAAARRVLTTSAVKEALKNTALVTTMLFFIVAASTTFAQILAISGATDGALAALGRLNLSPLLAVLAMVGVLLLLGCFLEQIAMMLLTLPFFMPLANSLNVDILWLSVILLIALQIGLLSPPFGLLLFVMRAVAPPEVTTQQIWAATLPFVFIVLCVLSLVIAVPWLATGLTRSM
jgi:tripartite ATP-independent transporter DctM subunit